jgi:oligopeptidase B
VNRRPANTVSPARRLAIVAVVLGAGCAGQPPPPMPPSSPPSSRLSASTSDAASAPRPPTAKKVPHETAIHGQKLVDDYFWMREKGSPDVVGYLEAENAYTAAMTKPLEPRAQRLYDEMLGRIKQDDDTPPVKDGAFRYYHRYETGKQYPIHCRRAVKDPSPEIVMLDVNELGKSEKFIEVHGLDVSSDDHLLAYLVDTVGFRQYTLKIKDLRTNTLLPEAIERVDASAWAKDNRTLFYVTEDAQTKRPNKLFRHVLGSKAPDELVYEEKDEMFDLDVGLTRDKAFVVVTSSSKTTSEVRVIDAAKPVSAPRVLAPREHDHEYYVDHRGGLFYIRTNSGGRNFRLVTAPVATPGRDKWTELVPTRSDVMLEHVMVFDDHMVLAERREALPVLSIYDFKTKKTTKLDQAEAVHDVSPDANPEFKTTTFRYRYQSPVTPPQIVELDIGTGKRTVLKQTPVLGGFDPSRYETARVFAPARDGTRVPVSLVFKKGMRPDGTHPLYLNAYGSYGIPMSMWFSSDRVSLLDRGVVCAVAHIRGGGDMGKAWHDQGRMMSKMNTFTDFIDVGEQLTKDGWARKGGLAVSGGSAGGLLMGAVANMRPDLFRVVLAYVPFVDVINTMLDESLPLTVGEFEEWGNPKKEPEFAYMMKYSPYDNVRAQAYPTMLVRTSYNDSQVMYWEPAKWVAKLRARKTDPNLLLFKVNMQPAGHGGQSGRFDRLRDTAFDYAFLLEQLGIAD